MKIIPVIDVKEGIAVAAKKGNRDKYKALISAICNSSDPLKLTEVYKKLGFSEIYVADLDGILYSKANVELLEKINEIIPVTADIGIKGKDDIELLKNLKNVEIVIGTETLPYYDFLHEIDNIILSLDVKNGKLINNLNLDLWGFIEKLKNDNKIQNKIQKAIILDLSQVGTSKGPNIKLCREIMKKLNDKNKKIIYGGGIKNNEDIQKLKGIGIYAVLVGTALHTGEIKPTSLASPL